VGVRTTGRAVESGVKLVGIGEARKPTSSVPPVSDATLMGNEDRGRVGGAADSQGRGNLYPSLSGTPPPD
jgi:hypothetical protein